MKSRRLVGLLIALLAFDGAAVEVADYRFDNGYGSTIGTAPSLSPIGVGHHFVTEDVVGVTHTVMQFPKGSGLELTGTNNFMPAGEFTLFMTVRLDDTVGYHKFVDFEGGANDRGLYLDDGALILYRAFQVSPATVAAGEYHDIALTRDGEGNVVGYVDGTPSFSGHDVNGDGVISPAATLRFFVDDANTSGREASAGAVARIRIFDTALNRTEVEDLDEWRLFRNSYE